MKHRIWLMGLALSLSWGFALDAVALDSPIPSDKPAAAGAAATDPKAAEFEAAWKAAMAARVNGPTQVKVKDQAVISLGKEHFFVPPAQAERLLKAMGNASEDQSFVGMIMPLKEGDDWMGLINYVDEGYVSDSDAKSWKADELMETMQEGMTASNEELTKNGYPPLEVVGWAEEPKYDPASHKLVWSSIVRGKNSAAPASESSINYRTLALGREGYLTFNVVTSQASLAKDKIAANELLKAVQFNEGRRYADHNKSTDRIAQYGIGALVAGVAAKKLGLIALIGAFLAKFAKIIFLVVIGFGATMRKYLGRLFSRGNDKASPTASVTASATEEEDRTDKDV